MLAVQLLALLVATTPYASSGSASFGTGRAPAFSPPGPVAAPPPSPAQPPAAAPPLRIPARKERPFTFHAFMGIDRGGEEIAWVRLGDGSEHSLYANQGFNFGVGLGFLHLPLGEVARLDTLATIGFKAMDVGGSDGSYTYTSFPVEVLERLAFDHVRLGAGVSHVLAPRLIARGVLAGWGDHDVEAGLGYVAQIEWVGHRPRSHRTVALGFRMLFDEFTVEGVPYDANSFFGLNLSLDL